MRQAIEQTAVYGILLIMLVLLILFGITTAEKGVNSLTGASDSQAVAVNTTPQPAPKAKSDLKIVGKDQRGTEPPWSQQLSHNLEGRDSSVAEILDNVSLNAGTWMQAGAKKLLGVIGGWASN
ncbi:MAG: hypothetical protein ACXVDB_10700, partial [Tumebacillaceae bacterium]